MSKNRGIIIFLLIISELSLINAQVFVRGDSNTDKIVDLSDAINTLNYLYSVSGNIQCQDSTDANDDGVIDISDVITTLNYLFIGDVKKLPDPHEKFGEDQTNDELSCEMIQECTNECPSEDSIKCGKFAYRDCGNFDYDSCLEYGKCVATEIHPPVINHAAMGVPGFIFVEDAGNLPIGQRFNIYTVIEDFSVSGIKTAKADILLEDRVIRSINLECEWEDNWPQSINCYGEWLAYEAELGENTYVLRLFIEVNTGHIATFNKNYNLNFNLPDKTLCKELIKGHNNFNENRANFIFIGYGLESEVTKDFLPEFSKIILDIESKNQDGLFAIEPFRSNKNKFNFWYIAQDNPINLCNGAGDCRDSSLLAASCDVRNSYKIIMKNRDIPEFNGRYDTKTTIISIPIDENVKQGLDARHYPLTYYRSIMSHETGHMFANLNDEYFFEGNIAKFTTNSINCYAGPKHTEQECIENTQWKHLIGNGCGIDGILDCNENDYLYNREVGCFEGCAGHSNGIFRSTRTGIMRDRFDGPISFGLWNEELIKKELDKLV